jgi:DNA-binding NarL/FixJ family response regulator
MSNSTQTPQVFITEGLQQVRSALRLMLAALHIGVAGEAASWSETMALAPDTAADVVLVHWGLLPAAAGAAMAKFRLARPDVRIIAISGQPACRQAALAAGADYFISKAEAPDRFADQLRVSVNGHRADGGRPDL